MTELREADDPARDRGPTPIVAGVALTDDQIARIAAAGGQVVWHGFAGSPHGALLPLPELPGLQAVVDRAEVWFGPGLSGEMLAHAPKVTWLQTNSAGVEGFLSPELTGSSVVVTNVRGMHSSTTGDHTLALMLALSRGLPGSVLSQSRGEWIPTPIEDITVMSGTRLLVLGTGAIGQAIATRAAAFGMSVRGVSRSGRTVPGFESVRPVSELADAVRGCDWFVIAAPVTSESRGIVSKAVLAAMKPSAILVNIARGAVVDEPALCEALARRSIRAAGLDVFEVEPLPASSQLWTLPNVLLTPHAGGAMNDYGGQAVEYLVANLRRYRSGEQLLSVVDKEAGY